MCKEYYIPSGNNPQLSFTLHGHLVEMYGAFQKAVRILSLLSGAPKYPASYGSATDNEIKEYLDSLFSLVISCKRRYMPKTW
jgi:hypothetical protein